MARRLGSAPAPCGKKKLSERHAQHVVETARRSQSEKRQECRVYFCPGCQAWHTSSSPYRTPEQRQADYLAHKNPAA